MLYLWPGAKERWETTVLAGASVCELMEWFFFFLMSFKCLETPGILSGAPSVRQEMCWELHTQASYVTHPEPSRRLSSSSCFKQKVLIYEWWRSSSSTKNNECIVIAGTLLYALQIISNLFLLTSLQKCKSFSYVWLFETPWTVHGTFQARILEWAAFPFPRESSQPRDWTQVSCMAGGFFTSWVTMEAQEHWSV